MKKIEINPVGVVNVREGKWVLNIGKEYRKAMTGMEGFGYVNVFYWFDQNDSPDIRSNVSSKKPYVKGPEELGVFATRSEFRPNLIGLTACPVKAVDMEKGRIEVHYIDAKDGTPIIDIKPYHPAVDRVKNAAVPEWCAHWPGYYEQSAEFDWESEFNF